MNKLIFALVLTTIGCANTQILDQAKREAVYRQQLENYDNTPIPTAGAGPIQMPKEWMDQWTNQTN